jgi:hypothetical protein
MCLEILAEKKISTPAIKAGAAELGIISDNTFADFEALDFLSNGSYNTDGFMSRDQWELGYEFALMDMKIRAANTTSLDFDQDILVAKLRKRDLLDSINLWL